MGDAFSEAMTLVVSDGAVVILGPDGISGALTPEAAEESARRLLAAAAQARRAITGDMVQGDTVHRE